MNRDKIRYVEEETVHSSTGEVAAHVTGAKLKTSLSFRETLSILNTRLRQTRLFPRF